MRFKFDFVIVRLDLYNTVMVTCSLETVELVLLLCFCCAHYTSYRSIPRLLCWCTLKLILSSGMLAAKQMRRKFLQEA